jgi:hypothetical protein
MQFTVKQIRIERCVYDSVNALGHDAAAQLYPEYRARLETSFKGSLGYQPKYGVYYKPVCIIEAEDLNGVFEIGNIGPEESITRLAQMHSVSVGDIIEDPEGAQHMVDSFGFKELTNV